VDLDALFREVHKGHAKARDELLRRLSERFALFLHHKVWNEADAEDILQDTLATILQKCEGLTIERSFVAWAHTVLINNVNQYYRKKGTRKDKLTQLQMDDAAGRSITVPSELTQRLVSCLRRLNRINRRHARILNLHYQGYSTKEICQKVGLQRDNLYLSLFRARTMLKRCLETGGLAQ